MINTHNQLNNIQINPQHAFRKMSTKKIVTNEEVFTRLRHNFRRTTVKKGQFDDFFNTIVQEMNNVDDFSINNRLDELYTKLENSIDIKSLDSSNDSEDL
jgi:hypothetical protein